MSSPDHLVEMANDIAAFFVTQPDPAVAVSDMVGHMEKFWEPRMRRRIVEQLHHDTGGLAPLALAAITELARRIDPASGDLHPR